ncbi:amino acid ABC transporter permease [Halotalea alkalilenta]|uniref:amino acid ABC transporter permease n=1 Tax=Halotalea alkalilenta TaxID=376489 RepID=UPI000480FD5D|nr:amino acid ABC transporter permease [Halotalea alkalilenta]
MLDFLSLLPYWQVFVEGIVTTLWVTVVATLLGLAIAVPFAWLRLEGPRLLSALIGIYVELIRNTPFIVQLFFIYFGLPALDLRLSATSCALIAMTLNLTAYATEIIRAGIQAVPKGQREAARVLGMSPLQSYRHVVLVPALSRIYPALTSQCIIVMLGSAVISQISVEELTYAANFIQSRNFRSFETYIVATLCYLGIAIAMRQSFEYIGRRLFGFLQGEQR